jgi:hypothetical protein
MADPSDLPDAPRGEGLALEDHKLLVLARATRGRARAAEGACARDTDGRTYAGATVALPSLRLSAVGVVVAMAVSAGATGLEAVAVLGEADTVAEEDLAVVRDFAGSGVTVLRAGPDGSLVGSTSS